MTFPRRQFFTHGLAAATALGTSTAWQALFASARAPRSRHEPLGAPDEWGVCVPAGFSVRLLATSGTSVAGTAYVWHGAPDGGAVFARTSKAGWIYVCNAELAEARGGVGTLVFNADGNLEDAWPILHGTTLNCAGGATPWGTWLSCEEIDDGSVWECNPQAPGQGIARPALGRFKHEAAAVDPVTSEVYLTEDQYDGRLYRFTPRVRGDLSRGVLAAASVAPSGKVAWVPVSATARASGPETSRFQRGEGAWFAHGVLYFSTTADHRVWAYDTRHATLEIIYDGAATAGPLRYPDNLTVHAASGDLYVAEDGDDLQIVKLSVTRGARTVTPFLQLVGHAQSELTGVAFSPDGGRLYFSSQRGRDGVTGMTFEVAGPFAG